MLRVFVQRCAALAGAAAIVAMIASNIWCESACIAEQPELDAASATTCHEAPSAPVSIAGHHDCRDHQLESLTAVRTLRVSPEHLVAALPVVTSSTPHAHLVVADGPAEIQRSLPPLIRTIAILRI